jgi:hypothetical protein
VTGALAVATPDNGTSSRLPDGAISSHHRVSPAPSKNSAQGQVGFGCGRISDVAEKTMKRSQGR